MLPALLLLDPWRDSEPFLRLRPHALRDAFVLFERRPRPRRLRLLRRLRKGRGRAVRRTVEYIGNLRQSSLLPETVQMYNGWGKHVQVSVQVNHDIQNLYDTLRCGHVLQ